MKTNLGCWTIEDLMKAIKCNLHNDHRGEYIGRKDRNGRKIHEGDIVKNDCCEHTVIWDDEYGGFGFEKCNGGRRGFIEIDFDDVTILTKGRKGNA